MVNVSVAYQAVLTPLLEKRKRLAEELANIDSAISALRAAQSAGDFDFGEAHINEQPEDAVEPKIYAGMTQPEAVFEVLRRKGRAMVAKEILRELESDGAGPSGSDPVKKIQVALNRRSEKIGDILHIGHGQWGICSWYSEAELEQFKQEIDGAGARDREEHARRMKEGIQRAKKNGAHYGSPPKITPEQWNLALKMVSDGVTNMSEIYREVIKLTPEGEEPFHSITVSRRKKDFLAGKPYPASWQRYFDNRRKAEATDSEAKNVMRVVK